MNFREFIEALTPDQMAAQQLAQRRYNVGSSKGGVAYGKPAAPPPAGSPLFQQPAKAARALTPQQAQKGQIPTRQQAQKQGSGVSQQDMWRLAKGQFTPEEAAIVQRQKAEMQKYGVVFTPFKLYGGGQNPQSSLANPAYQGKPDLSQFKFQ